MKSIEARVAALEKEVQRIKKSIDKKRLLKDTDSVMTPAEMGRKGGKATGKKGLAAMTPEQREAIRAKALETRRQKASQK